MADIDRRGDLEVRIVGTDGQTEASVTSNNRLQTQAYLEPFVAKSDYDTGNNYVSSGTYTSYINVTSTVGKIDFIGVVSNNSNYQVRLTIDGAEVYDISMTDLNTLGLANATNVEIWAESANKRFRHHPHVAMDFTNSFKLEAISTGTTVTTQWIVMYREAS